MQGKISFPLLVYVVTCFWKINFKIKLDTLFLLLFLKILVLIPVLYQLICLLEYRALLWRKKTAYRMKCWPTVKKNHCISDPCSLLLQTIFLLSSFTLSMGNLVNVDKGHIIMSWRIISEWRTREKGTMAQWIPIFSKLKKTQEKESSGEKRRSNLKMGHSI